MAKRPCVEFILLLINLVFTLTSVGTIGFGLICFLRFKQSSSSTEILDHSNTKSFIAHRMLLAIHHPYSQQIYDQLLLPKTWFVFLLIAIGAILFIISCCGVIGTTFRSRCCLLSYCIFLVALVAVELATAAFIFFKHDWKEIMPEDTSGNFHRVYQFLSVKWKIIKWVALGVLITQVIAIVLAVYLRRVLNRPKWHGKRDDDKHVQYLPRVRTRIPNYRILSQDNSNNGGGPTRPT